MLRSNRGDLMTSIWMACLQEAWDAYGAGSVPVGALFVDNTGRIIYRGRNRINESTAPSPFLSHTRLAHAEMNVLAQVSSDDYAHMANGTLYTTLEPCPMCTGAIVMSGVRHVQFGALDREAGATSLWSMSPYMARKSIRVTGPEPEIQTISLTLMTVRLLRKPSRRTEEFLTAFAEDDATAVALGRQWAASGFLTRCWAEHMPIDNLAQIVLRAQG